METQEEKPKSSWYFPTFPSISQNKINTDGGPSNEFGARDADLQMHCTRIQTKVDQTKACSPKIKREGVTEVEQLSVARSPWLAPIKS